MSTRRLLAADPALLSEREWSGLVAEIARLGQWLAYHTFRSKHSPAGFPDWVFVKGPRLVFAELKTETGRTSPKQQEWLDALREPEGATKGLVQVYLWRPRDYPEVVEVLTGRRPAGDVAERASA